MVSVVLIIVAVCGVLWHFAEAWKLLPGARMISGLASDAVPPFREERLIHNPLRDYMVTRGLVVLYAMLLSAFSFARGDGWGYHYILLAWMMSLLSRFTSRVSVVWLAITTSVFLQGIGAYGLYFLRSPEHWPDFDDDSSDD